MSEQANHKDWHLPDDKEFPPHFYHLLTYQYHRKIPTNSTEKLLKRKVLGKSASTLLKHTNSEVDIVLLTLEDKSIH